MEPLDASGQRSGTSHGDRPWIFGQSQASDPLPHALLTTLQEVTLAVAGNPVDEQLLRDVVALIESRIPGAMIQIQITDEPLSALTTPISIPAPEPERLSRTGAELRLPIYFRNRVIGGVTFGIAGPTVSVEAVTFIKHLVNVIETGLERTEGERGRGGVQVPTEPLVTLAEELERSASISDLQPVLSHVVAIFGLHAVLHLSFPDAPDDLVSSVASAQQTGVEPREFLSTRVVQRAIRDGDTQFIVDCQRDQSAYRPVWERAAQAVVMPISDLDRCIAVLSLEVPEDRPLGRDDVRVVSFIATMLAPTLSRLLSGNDQARGEFSTALIRDVTTLLTNGSSEEEFMDSVATAVSNTLDWSCALAIVEGDHLRFTAVACAGGAEPASWLDDPVPISVGVTGRVARTGESVFQPDVTQDPDFLETIGQTTSEICLPLVVESSLIGIVNFETVAPKRLDAVDYDLAVSLSRLVELGLRLRRMQTGIESTNGMSDIVREVIQSVGGSGEPAQRSSRLIEVLRRRKVFSEATVWQLTNERLELLTGTARPGGSELLLAGLEGDFERTIAAGLAYVNLEWRGPASVIATSRVHGIAVYPIRHGDEVRGILAVAGREDEPLQHRYLTVVELAATMIGLVVANDVAEREIDRVAGLDPVSGVPNVEYARQKIDSMLADATAMGSQCSAMLLDIDAFREFNQRRGRQAGDALLRAMADTLVEQLRGDDLIARFGSDEFLVVLPDTDERTMMSIAERIRSAVSELGRAFGTDQVTISSGIATYPNDADSGRALIRAAEVALAAAKDAGHNQTTAYRDLSNLERGDLVRRWYTEG